MGLWTVAREAGQLRMLSSEERERLGEALAQELLVRPEIVFAYLHGSFVESGRFRDLDLAVYVDLHRAGCSSSYEYENVLSVKLTLAMGMPVDVRLLNNASLAFRYHALKGRVLVARNVEVLDDFRARTWDDYIDFDPFAKQYLREVLSG